MAEAREALVGTGRPMDRIDREVGITDAPPTGSKGDRAHRVADARPMALDRGGPMARVLNMDRAARAAPPTDRVDRVDQMAGDRRMAPAVPVADAPPMGQEVPGGPADRRVREDRADRVRKAGRMADAPPLAAGRRTARAGPADQDALREDALPTDREVPEVLVDDRMAEVRPMDRAGKAAPAAHGARMDHPAPAEEMIDPASGREAQGGRMAAAPDMVQAARTGPVDPPAQTAADALGAERTVTIGRTAGRIMRRRGVPVIDRASVRIDRAALHGQRRPEGCAAVRMPQNRRRTM